MARTAYAASVSSASRSANIGVTTAGPTDDPFSGSLWAAVDAANTAMALALVDVDAATAVLVADAATPTQAHVTTLNTALTTLDTASAAITTAWAAFVASTDHAVLLIDTSKTNEQKRAIMHKLADMVVVP